LTTPVFLNGPFAFLGVAAYLGKDGLELETWWQVTQTPITRPLSSWPISSPNKANRSAWRVD
jgi:hypothetical protein